MKRYISIIFFGIIFTAFDIWGENLLRNGDFSKTLELVGAPLGWSIHKGREGVSLGPDGMLMNGKFRILQRVDIPHEAATAFCLKARIKVDSGKVTLFAQAFLPGVIKSESYLSLASKSFKASAEWQELNITINTPPNKTVSQIQVSLSSNLTETSACVSNISLTPIPPQNSQKNKIYLSSADKKILCKGIFLPESESIYEIIAAKTLQKHLYRMTGYLLPILKVSKSTELPGTILIGKAALETKHVLPEELEKVGSGGFLVKNKDLTLSIAGKDNLGLNAGVYEFLKSIGIKFLSSEEVEYPALESLSLGAVKYTKAPAFPFRNKGRIFNCEFLPEASIADTRRIGGMNGNLHTNGFLVNFDKYHNEHPEYFALQKDGKRLNSKPHGNNSYVHLCMSNPKVQKIASESLLKWIELDPAAEYFCIGQGDIHNFRCVCDKCKAMDYEEGNYTDRVLSFVNKVTEKASQKYPDKIFFMLLYEGADKMPVKTKPAPHVRLMYCPFRPKWWCHSHAFCEHNKEGVKEAKEWFKKYPGQLYVFDYPAGAKEALSIFGSFYAMVDKIRFYSANGVKGVTLCGTPKQFNALFTNVISKLLWNPGINVEESIDEFMMEYYGPAAPFMRQYFNLIYKTIKARKLHQNCELFNTGMVDDDFKRKAYTAFALADNAAKNQPKLLKRIKREKLFLLYNDLNEHNPYTDLISGDLNDFAEKLAEFAKIAREEEIYYLDRKHVDLNQWFWEKAGLKLKGAWQKSPKIDKLISNPLKTLRDEENRLQTKTEKGWEINASSFKGGEPSRDGKYIVIRRPALLKSTIAADLYLDKAPKKAMELEITGKEEKDCRIAVLVNGREIHIKNPSDMFYDYPKEYDWKISGIKQIKIPAKDFKKGKNTIEIKNLTSEYPLPKGKKATNSSGYQPNPFWGWLIVEKININGEKEK